jgi:hypothetical protein
MSERRLPPRPTPAEQNMLQEGMRALAKETGLIAPEVDDQGNPVNDQRKLIKAAAEVGAGSALLMAAMQRRAAEDNVTNFIARLDITPETREAVLDAGNAAKGQSQPVRDKAMLDKLVELDPTQAEAVRNRNGRKPGVAGA